MPRRVILVPHDPRWIELAAQEADRIRHTLGPVLIELHHIGSTAIPGINAKPILDLLGVVSSLSLLEEKNGALEDLGYVVRGERGIP